METVGLSGLASALTAEARRDQDMETGERRNELYL